MSNWGTGVLAEAGNILEADMASAAKADVTVVVDEIYRIVAPMIGTIVFAFGADPTTIANATGIVPPGGWVDVVATNTTLSISCKDTTASYGTNYDCTAYVVRMSQNA